MIYQAHSPFFFILDCEQLGQCIDYHLSMCILCVNVLFYLFSLIIFWSSRNNLIFNFEGGF